VSPLNPGCEWGLGPSGHLKAPCPTTLSIHMLRISAEGSKITLRTFPNDGAWDTLALFPFVSLRRAVLASAGRDRLSALPSPTSGSRWKVVR